MDEEKDRDLFVNPKQSSNFQHVWKKATPFQHVHLEQDEPQKKGFIH